MKILVGLIEHFGDIVACEPVSRYLRHKYPEAHISWAVQKPYRELVDTNPNVDETIVVVCLTDWIRLYKHTDYDLIVDLHVNFRICPHCQVPLVKEHGDPFVNAFEWFDYGALLEAFSLGAGLPKLSAQPRVYLEDKHRAAVNALGLPAEYCVIHRVSNAAAKDWPDEKWRQVVDFLIKDAKIPVVEVGSLNKQAGAGAQQAETSDSWSAATIDLRNKTSLLETAEVIRRAKFYIGIDSGPAHLANAVKTPGVILLGRLGSFRQYTPYTGFYASRSPEIRIVRNLTGYVAEIAVDEVLEAIRYLSRVLAEKRTERIETPKTAAISLTSDPTYRQKVLDSGFFDPAWYVTHHGDLPNEKDDPLDHFITHGERAGHSPGPDFDAVFYKRQRPDLANIPDPLRHYLTFGRAEGMLPIYHRPTLPREAPPAVSDITQTQTALREEYSPVLRTADDADAPPRIFAFYLPQFHPINENNWGHRPGFTEWDNVIKAKPLFKGHYQPRLPGELGYYDLRSVDVMREQVTLANSHGIDGFCFYYYYFQGQKLLYKPIENYLNSDIKAPFFFLWANENWTRRWDGGDDEVIVSQNHSREDDLAFIAQLLPVFADDRYLKINGKPVLSIYKQHLFPDILQTTELLRSYAEKHGFPGLYLIMVDDWASDVYHPRELGFDGSYEIPSNIVTEGVLSSDTKQLGLKNGFTGRIVDYNKFASFHMGRPSPPYRRFRTVMAPWDNTPRYGLRAMVHINTDNDAYRTWMLQALVDTYSRFVPEERIMFLHSWNEWCEGTYVEPDGRNKRRYLEETREAVEEFRKLLAFPSLGQNPQIGAAFLELMRGKDIGAARSLQAMRQQNWYIHRVAEQRRLEAEKLVADRVALESKLQEAHNLIHTMHQSRSWKITKPLRALTQPLKKS